MRRPFITLLALAFVALAVRSIINGQPAWSIAIRVVIAALFSAQAIMLWRQSRA